MRRMLVVKMKFIFPLAAFLTTVLATGSFTSPSGADGSLTVITGDKVSVAWTNTADYDVLSLGYFSGSNQTITWLISNSKNYPTSYKWTVDAVAKGFNLSDSRLFAFYICKDYNFGSPFVSSTFIVNDATASSTSTLLTKTSSTASATSLLPPTTTPTADANPLTTTPTSSAAAAAHTGASSTTGSTASSGLSSGAIAGLVVGVVVGVAGFAAAAFMYFRQRQQPSRSTSAVTKYMSEAPSDPASSISAYDKAQGGSGPTQDLTLGPPAFMPAQEAAGSSPSFRHGHPVEMGSGRTGGDSRAELP